MKNLADTQLARAAWAGIVGPVLFVTVFLVEGYLRPGYNSFSMYVSALSLVPWLDSDRELLTVRPAAVRVYTGGRQ